MPGLISRFSTMRSNPTSPPADTLTPVNTSSQKDSEASGSIVAFEGHPETISTQLRLLPTSPQILILPGVHCYLPTDDGHLNYEVHDYIRKAHDALMTRNETARAFLQTSTPSDKRLVFMNGGTPSAQALCIKHIMRHETQGDEVEAEVMFNFLVKEGLGGLELQAKKWTGKDSAFENKGDGTEADSGSSLSPRASPQDQERGRKQRLQQQQQLPGALDEDPITRAMRAAEALDRQTANLQPCNDLDLTLTPRPRSASLPMYGYSDSFGDAAPFFVFGSRRQANSEATTEQTVDDALSPLIPPRFSITHYDEQTLDQSVLTVSTDPEPSPSCVGEIYGPTFLHSPIVDSLPTSKSDVFDARSPADVVFGEASLIDMRLPANRGPITRVRSLDRICSSVPKYRELCIPPRVVETDREGLRRRHSCIIVPDETDPTSSRLNLIDGPRTVVVRPKLSRVVSLSAAPTQRDRKPNRSSYVDRGTDAEVAIKKPEAFVSVLPVTEDLVIYFKDEVSDAILDTIMKSFRDGGYPILANSPDGSEADTVNDQLPSTPTSQSIYEDKEAHKETFVEADEYDPFAYVQNTWPPLKSVKSVPRPMKVERPPTPEKSPVPYVSNRKEEKFYEFKFSSNQTAVAIQNSLRSVLSIYFPPGTSGYRQFNFSLLPELEGLWKPIFREAEPGSPRANNRRMDQILAVGSQKDVRKTYSSAIVGLLDKLGTKKSGMRRSGRLDFRYLLANAMQTFTAQPLTNQTSDNPFNNPYLLATLIIPHLETYLALHPEVRYLVLEYPPDHLSTILALQRLVGVDLMKVAQIVDSESSDMGHFTHIRGASINDEKSQNPLGKPIGLSAGSTEDFTVTKGNFLLTLSASDTEIATFIATVRKILMDISSFYTPEDTHQATTLSGEASGKAKSPLQPGNVSHFPKSDATPNPTNTTDFHILASPAIPTKAASIAETIRTYRTTRMGRGTKKSSKKPSPMADGESIMTFDPAEDSDYDMEERRLMPIFMQQPPKLQKPNSRKALKFLGLA